MRDPGERIYGYLQDDVTHKRPSVNCQPAVARGKRQVRCTFEVRRTSVLRT